ncbi:hypothetical protein [Microtetraspora malaysiensis]|uniref:hypothetical protein n=1 Tax=Microtetraspora malaysiensis TaxID=161358 RepID=UPI003D935FC9
MTRCAPSAAARIPDRTKALNRAHVEALLSRQSLALRERTLFRLLYESAARAEEVRALDVADVVAVGGPHRTSAPRSPLTM